LRAVRIFLNTRFPIRGPNEVAGINVAGEPLRKAMKLVSTDEVHLARQAGAIALRAQIMRECWHFGWKLRAIVISADPGTELPGHH